MLPVICEADNKLIMCLWQANSLRQSETFLDHWPDLALLSHAHQHMQEKTQRLSKFGQQVRLQISKRKMEVMTLNMNASAPVLCDDQAFPSTETFTYLGSTVRQDEGTNEDI